MLLQHSLSSIASHSHQARLAVLEQARTLLIRHANSTFNSRWSHVQQKIARGEATEDGFIEVVNDMSLLDCPLSDLGISQCLQEAPLVSQLSNIRTVFVSPLRRALQTAFLLFREHPNFSRMRFIVHPLLRENMHTVCDIPESHHLLKSEFLSRIP